MIILFKRGLSIALAAILMLSSIVVAGAQTTNNGSSYKDYELPIITRKIENNIPVYYDGNGEKVDITKYNRSIRTYSDLPQSYDLRDENRVTSVKDQGSEGLCWDFGATAALESNILSQPEFVSQLPENAWETLDLSEAGNSWYIYTNLEDKDSVLYNSYYNDPKKGSGGGFADDVAMGLSSGYGLYPEELLPYENWSNGYNESLRFYSDYRLRDFVVLENDVDLVKQSIINNGAVTVSYNCFSSNYNTTDGIEAYYDYGFALMPSESDLGHLVAIVGWDDDFSREYFHEDMRPENNGAWLCKNSWGEDFGCTIEGYEGYFWMSYETDIKSLTQFEVQSVDEFDNIYQNEVVANSLLYDLTSYANVFTAKSDEVLKQISLHNMGYADLTVDVYKLNDNYTSPVDGECVLSFDASVDKAGIHCIDCPDEVNLSASDVFSVVITDENGFSIHYADEADNERSHLSYFVNESGEWVDVYDADWVSYVSIKAYTSNKDGAVHKDKLSQSIEKAEAIEYSEDIPQYMYDELIEAINNAKAVLADNSSTQNTVDNTICLLNNSIEYISEYVYYIDDLDDFMEFYNKSLSGDTIPSVVVLNTDLDLSSVEYFEPMFINRPFAGVFDGNNHTISGLNIDSFENASLFAQLSYATIKDVTFSDFNVVGTGFVGVISSYAKFSTFTNCVVKDSFVASDDSAGGFLGFGREPLIEECAVNDCEVLARNSAGPYTPFVVETMDSNANGTKVASTSSLCTADNIDIFGTTTNSCMALISAKDSKCTVENFMGEIANVTVEGTTVVKNGDVYEFDIKDNGESYISIDIEYVEDEVYEFGYSVDLLNRKLTLISYYGNESEITIPHEIGGLEVEAIADDFEFYGENPITGITFSGGLKSVGSLAFVYMRELETVVFEEGIQSIGPETFSNC